MATTLLSGASFGAALVAAGVHQPAVILGQLKFEDWHMLQTFLAAAASSSLVVVALDKLDVLHPKPRSASRLGLFGPYDGNILGGALQGVGMVLAGACPGTVIPQAAVGLPTGLYALAGTFLGGVAWAGFLGPRLSRCAASAPPEDPRLTVHERAGISRAAGFFAFQAACAAAVYACAQYAPGSHLAVVAPAAGGLFIGVSQLVSMVSRKAMLGVSASYEEAGRLFFWLVRGARDALPSSRNVLFAVGVAGGAWAVQAADPAFAVPAAQGDGLLPVSPLLAVAGGVCLAVGARISGGCTSGHGISGMSMFSTSSFITVASIFGTGALLALLFR
ncbi:YeeE/YedE family protein [Sodiomyces alkalinus F11]|uniref:YeeE/YedE family protein n=1 Tax=Sodiomyces alkalinus (strain CBS 110278 / VKM F-3762 / F11) TaxID=1314773 RepID=A0A3N2PVZ4_SODAK|nr:YeeE/YedE family protein [Sodiomyces alkalinus F11]ROT38665.1 YeeE/YedE family protein [Sodiomyces alkalinus F11]